MQNELTTTQKKVYDVLRKGYDNKVNLKYISKLTNLSVREVVRTISELREFYPICSTTYDGGGVWIADCNKDIVKFITLTQKRAHTHQLTINHMERHIK